MIVLCKNFKNKVITTYDNSVSKYFSLASIENSNI